MDNLRHWIGYDTFKSIIALILLIIIVVLLLQGGGQGAPAAAVSTVAPATSAVTQAATTVPAATALPTASLAATATQQPTAAATATLKPTTAPTATLQPTAAATATPPPAAPTATLQPTAAPTVAPQPAPVTQPTAVRPSVTAVDLVPGRRVRLEFNNLPPNSNFAVKMGAGGTGAVGGSTVANISSGAGGTLVVWVEILSELTNASPIDVRIENGAGYTATTTFDNTSAFTPPAAPKPVPAVSPTAAPVRTIKVLHVQKGGVAVAQLTDLPANTVFIITMGKAGTQGIGGYGSGTMTTSATAGQTVTGTFEIPLPVRNEPSIDLRLEADGVVYLTNFQNITY